MHVLFVHGVGTHSRLSSLLQAYQALRANTRSPEAPIVYEDPIPEWRLRTFDDGASTPGTPHLKLALNATTPGATEAVYFYEVNYSALAGVVRANQPLDLTGLFVGFDLAVNVARARLQAGPVPAAPAGSYAIDHNSMARTVQKLAGVLAAATVPILGIPSLVFRRFARTLVGTFTRFFEDVATFALDMNGEQLISAHVDRTVETIVKSPCFEEARAGHGRDSLVIVAHSLGTIVTHNYVLRHGLGAGGNLPSRVLTFGSPIGFVCWLWLFLDFMEMDFAKRDPDASHYFTWTPLKSASALPTLEWVNVVNRLDPIATAFPLDYVNLSRTPQQNAAALEGGGIDHRFIDTGSSAGSAHTAYFDDRRGFLEILGRLAGLRAPPSGSQPALAPRTAREHWREVIQDLHGLRVRSWLGGLALIGAYLGVISWAWKSFVPMAFVAVFLFPPLTIGTLAFFQRLFFSKPTKRTAAAAIAALPVDLWSFPHRLRQSLRRKQTPAQERAYVLASGPGLAGKLWMWALSFMPSLAMMLLPVLFAWWWLADGRQGAWTFFTEHWGLILPGMLGLFTLYLVAFAVSEFVAYWREAVEKARALSEVPVEEAPNPGARSADDGAHRPV